MGLPNYVQDYAGEPVSERYNQTGFAKENCILLKTDYHASASPLSFLQAGCSSWCQTKSVKALKGIHHQGNWL